MVINMNNETKYINILTKLANKAYKKNEVPVSALIVYNNKIIAKAYNKKNIKNNALYHAEILCIIKATKKLKNWNLDGCSLYVSLEPCDMCKLIIQESRISNVYYILKQGKVNNKYKKTKYEQMYACENLNLNYMLKTFFKKMRK